MLQFSEITPSHVKFPSFIRYCILDFRILFSIFVLCFVIFLFGIFIYSLCIAYISPQMSDSRHSFIVDLCVNLHLVIKNKIFYNVNQYIEIIIHKNKTLGDIVKIIWEMTNPIIVPHVPLDKYYEHAGDNNLYIAFYIGFYITIPIAAIVFNPIQFAISNVIDDWVIACIYEGDFSSSNTNKMYSIINEGIKRELPSIIRSFFIIVGICVMLYVLSIDLLAALEKKINFVVENIMIGKHFLNDSISKNNEFLLEMKKKTQNQNYKFKYIANVFDEDQNCWHEQTKEAHLIDFFQDMYATFTREGSLVMQEQSSLRQNLNDYSSSFRSRLFLMSLVVFVVVFIIFFIEAIYIPNVVDNNNNNNNIDMASFLYLAETFKNVSRHNFLLNFSILKSSKNSFRIMGIFVGIWKFILKFRVGIICCAIIAMIKVMWDRVFGNFITNIKNDFFSFTSLNSDIKNIVCSFEMLSDTRSKLLNTCESLVPDMISPAILDIVNIFLDTFTENVGKNMESAIVNDNIAKGIAYFSADLKKRVRRPVFQKVFGGMNILFDTVYKFLVNIYDKNVLIKDNDINDLMKTFIGNDNICQLFFGVSNLAVSLSNFPYAQYILSIAKILYKLMTSKFKDIETINENKEIFNNKIIEYKNSLVIDHDLNQEIVKFVKSKNVRDNGVVSDDLLMNNYAVYNLLHLIPDAKEVMDSVRADMAKIFKTNVILPHDKYFDIITYITNIGESLIKLIFPNGQVLNEEISKIIDNCLSIVNVSSMVIYNSMKIASGQISTSEQFEKISYEQTKYNDRILENLKPLYYHLQNLFNKSTSTSNLMLIIKDISIRIGFIVGSIVGLICFFSLVQPLFILYKFLTEFKSLVSVYNNGMIYFNSNNIDSVDMVIIDFGEGFNINKSYNTLAKGLRLFIDLKNNSFYYINHGVLRRIDVRDNLFVSIIGDSGSGKSVVLNLLSLSNLQMLQNSVNKGEIRCCMTLKDSSKVNVPVDAVDLRIVQKAMNLLFMKQDQPYNFNDLVKSIISQYSGNTARENKLSLPPNEIANSFRLFGKLILSDLGILDIYDAKVQRKIGEISGGQRQRFGLAAMFSNMIGNCMDFNLLDNLYSVYEKISGDLNHNTLNYCSNIINNILYQSLMNKDEMINVYRQQLKEVISVLNKKINLDMNDNDYFINYMKDIIMNIIIDIEHQYSIKNIKNTEGSDNQVKVYIFDESLSALNNAVKDNVMKLIRDIFGVNKNKYPTITNSVAFMVEHGSISTKYADISIVCFLEDINNSSAVCGTFYEILNDFKVPIAFKEQILTARLEEILSSKNVSDQDKDNIMLVYRKIQSGEIVDKDWSFLPRIDLLDSSKSKVVHHDLFEMYLNLFQKLDVVYDMKSESIKLLDNAYES